MWPTWWSSTWVTRLERPKGIKDKVKQARRMDSFFHRGVFTVKRIPNYGMFYTIHMDPDLMSSPGAKLYIKVGVMLVFFYYLKVSCC